MHFRAFLLLTNICKVKKSLNQQKTPQRHDSCLNLSQITTICSILTPFSHYFMPDPDFKVRIMAGNKRKCNVFCFYCIQTATENHRFCEKAYL